MVYSKTILIQICPSLRLQDVNELPVKHQDSMPTHATGQTLKYLWLLLGREPIYSVRSGWIFNLEGHPIKY